MITKSQIETATKILKTDPDGTEANRQARIEARLLLMARVIQLFDFIKLNPLSKSADAQIHVCAQLMEVVNASYEEVK